MNEPCPSAEVLAAYGDGKLTPAERREVEEHVAACEDCFELFAGAAAYRLEEAGEGAVISHPATRRPWLRWQYAAAAATIVVAVWAVARQQATFSGGGQVLALVQGLGDAEQLGEAAARAWNDGGGLGFGGGLPTGKRAFRMGVHLLDARVALEAGDGAHLEAAVERAAVLLPTRGGATEILARLRSGVASEGGTARHRADLDRLTAAARRLDPAAFDLGAWAEAGRLAAAGGSVEFLTSSITERLDEAIRRSHDEPAQARAVEAIRAELADRQVAPNDLSELERSFEQLILLN